MKNRYRQMMNLKDLAGNVEEEADKGWIILLAAT